MVKLIVLESNIASMTEFKQIIGRGTRIRESDGKVFFTILDFRKATNLFADPDFDGDPVQIYEPDPSSSVVPPDVSEDQQDDSLTTTEDIGWSASDAIFINEDESKVNKYYINNIPVSVANERVQYYGKGGKLITESLKDYTRENVLKTFSSQMEFSQKWKSADRKEELIKELAEQGILLEALKEEVGKDMDEFDLICHIAYDQPPLTRKERANNVRKRNYFSKYGQLAQEVLYKLLDKYEEQGLMQIEKGSVLKVKPLNELGSPVQLVRAFGGKKEFDIAIKELENEIYQTA